MNKLITSNWLAFAAMILIALSFGSFPYAFNQLANWTIAIAALATAYTAKKSGQKMFMRIFIAVAVVFNPVAPIYFTAEQWRTLDIAAILLFAISVLKVKKLA